MRIFLTVTATLLAAVLSAGEVEAGQLSGENREKWVCVPGQGENGWLCGRNSVSPPQSMAPEAAQPSTIRPQYLRTSTGLLPGQVSQQPPAAETVEPAKPASPVVKPEATVAATPIPTATATPTPIPAPIVTPTPAPTPTEPLSSKPLRFTIQLSSMPHPNGFARVVDRHSLDPEQARHVEVMRDGKPWWLLLYGEYADRSAAETARDLFPDSLRSQGPWIRRSDAIH